MTKKADTWMPFYVGDYLADTMLLTTLQHGAYLLLMLACWKAGGSLPDDDIALATAARLTPADWKRCAPALRRFFDARDGQLFHKRISHELARAQGLSDKRTEAGANGAGARWGSDGEKKTRSQRLAEAREKGRHTPAEWDALKWATGYRCVCCGISADELDGGVLTKDHITPLYQGGDDSIENIQPACKNCNSSKGRDKQDRRETASPGWRERLAKRLAKRLANATQTPRPSPSHKPTTSDADASAGKPAAPMPPAPPPPTAKDIVFALGVPLLTAAGVKEANARSFLGMQVKAHGDAKTAEALQACASERPVGPISWLQARLGPIRTGAAKSGRHAGFDQLDYHDGVNADGHLA